MTSLNSTATIELQNNVFIISGELDFNNVSQLFNKSLEDLKNVDKNAKLIFDFKNVQSSNSAGLALIMEWLKLANANQTVEFTNIPEKLIAIAKVAGIEALINHH